MYKINIRAVCARRRAMIPESHKSGHRGPSVGAVSTRFELETPPSPGTPATSLFCRPRSPYTVPISGSRRVFFSRPIIRRNRNKSTLITQSFGGEKLVFRVFPDPSRCPAWERWKSHLSCQKLVKYWSFGSKASVVRHNEADESPELSDLCRLQ